MTNQRLYSDFALFFLKASSILVYLFHNKPVIFTARSLAAHLGCVSLGNTNADYQKQKRELLFFHKIQKWILSDSKLRIHLWD